MPHKAKRVRRQRKKAHPLITHTKAFFRGATALYVIIGIVILGAVMFAGGAIPEFGEDTLNRSGPGGIIDEESLKNEPQRDVLQILPIKFKECSSQVAVVMMLDRSGSMEGAKLNRLKQATLDFTSQMTDDSVIGIQSFSGVGITEDVPVSYYKDVRDLVPQKIDALRAGGNTPTYSAISLSYQILVNAQQQFPEKNLKYLFVSDGLPVPPGEQDPYLFDPNPVNQIKDLGIEIFTIGIFSPYETSGINLLLRIASRPGNFYNSPDGSQLSKIYEQISEQICSGSN